MNYLILCLTILVVIILIYKFKIYLFYNLPHSSLIIKNYTFQDLKNNKNICILRDNSISSSTYDYYPEKKICKMTDNFYAFCITDLNKNVEFNYGKHNFSNIYCPSIFILNDKRIVTLTISFKDKTLIYDVAEEGSKIINDIESECDSCSLSSMEYYDRPFIQAHNSKNEVLYGMLLNKSNQICFYIMKN